jgi:hypothetical protein
MTVKPISTFILHSERREVSLNSVGKQGYTAFITVGIINPLGPCAPRRVVRVAGHGDMTARSAPTAARGRLGGSDELLKPHHPASCDLV